MRRFKNNDIRNILNHVTPTDVPMEWSPGLDPIGRYVYVWFDGIVPFYVGRGAARRAWEPHCKQGGTPEPCERRRRVAKEFSSVIIANGLTENGAAAIEGGLINFLKIMGMSPVCNQVSGQKKTRGQMTL